MVRQGVSDLSHTEYRKSLVASVGESLETLSSKPAGKYQLPSPTTKERKPVDCPGITLLAEPIRAKDPCNPYAIEGFIAKNLEKLQDKIKGETSRFVPVPPETLHLTVADLLWEERYEVLINSQGSEIQKTPLFQEIDRLLKRLGGSSTSLSATIVGVGGFPGVVVALVDFESSDYDRIKSCRDEIYSNFVLANYGVFREYPFLGHVTLGYIEAVPPYRLDSVLNEIRLTNPFGWTFQFETVGIYQFENMSAYKQVQGGYPI